MDGSFTSSYLGMGKWVEPVGLACLIRTFLFKDTHKISKGPLKYQICLLLQHQVDIYWTGSEDNYRTSSEDNYRMFKLPYLQHPVDINRKS